VPYCPSCGSKITEGKFCPYCGEPTGFSAGPDTAGGPPPDKMGYYPPPPPAYYPSSRPPPDIKKTSVVPWRQLSICSGVGIVSMCVVSVSAFLPWVSYSGANIRGLNRDGRLILILGVIGIASAVLAAILKSRWPFLVLMLTGIAVVSVLLSDVVNVTRTTGLSLSNVGIGLYLGAASGVVALVAGAAGLALRPSAPISPASSG
jgi:hypothetical protein